MLNRLKSEKALRVLGLLTLEILALVSFSFGSFSWIFGFFSFLVALCALPFLMDEISNKEWKSIALFMVPLFLYAFINALSTFSRSVYPFYINLALFFGIIGIFLLGVLAKKNKASSDMIFVVIGAALGLHLLLSILPTLFRYGFFHTILYKDLYYFYNGVQYPVYTECLMLYGFDFVKVDVKYFSLYPTLLASGLFVLPFVSFKENKTKFLTLLGIGLLGLLSVVLIGYFKALVFLIPVAIFAIAFFFLRKESNFLRASTKEKTEKIIKNIIVVLMVLVVLVFITVVFNANGKYDNNFVYRLTTSNKLLNKIFNTNSFITKINDSLSSSLKASNLLGLNFSAYPDMVNCLVIETNIFEIEAVKEVGFIGVLVLILLIICGFFYFRKFLISDENSFDKAIITAFVLTFIFYESFNYSTFAKAHLQDYLSFIREMPTTILIFLFGFIALPKNKENELAGQAKEAVVYED